MKTLYIGFFVALLSAPVAFADDELPQGDFFFGFSGLRTDSSKTILVNTSLGGIGTLGWNITEHVGIEAEFGGYHNGYVDSFHDDTNSVTYLFGPRLSYGRMKRVDPYAHVLIGGIHTATGVLRQTSSGAVFSDEGNSRFTKSQDGLAVAVGGGIDVKLNNYISFRPVQLDYLLTKLADIGPTGLSNNSFHNNIQYTVGFVFHFNDRQ